MAGVLEAFLGGQQARRVADAAAQVNAMNAFLQQNGQAVFNGDPNALGQLAGMGPQGLETAFNVRGRMEDRARVQKADARGDQEWQMRVEEYAASKTAAERAAEAAQIEEGVKMGLGATTPQQWDALVTQAGAEDLVGQFENREAIAQRYMSVAEILKGQQGPAYRKATPEEAAAYGAQAGQFDDKGKFYPLNPPSGTSLTTGPDGSVTFQQGVGVGAKPLTEGQSKDVGFATRARGAMKDLDPIDAKLLSRGNRALDVVPLGLGREFQDTEFQLAQGAGREFLVALLRKDTGAVVTQEEEALYGSIYLPEPGDSPERVAQKRQARERAIAGIEAGLPPTALAAQEIAIAKGAAVGATTPADSSGSQPQVAAPSGLSPEAQSAFEKYRSKPGSAATPAP
jgi:hypothetical protein